MKATIIVSTDDGKVVQSFNNNKGYYMAVRRYGFYLDKMLIVSLTSERSERVRDVFNTRRLNPSLQAAMYFSFY